MNDENYNGNNGDYQNYENNGNINGDGANGYETDNYYDPYAANESNYADYSGDYDNNGYDDSNYQNSGYADSGYDDGYVYAPAAPKKKDNKGMMVAIISVVSVIIVVGLIVAILFATGVIGKSKEEKLADKAMSILNGINDEAEDAIDSLDDDKDDDKDDDEDDDEDSKKEAGEIRYITNCDDSAYIRSEPKDSSDNIIATADYGEKVIFLKNINNKFAKVKYDGETGYVERANLSSSKPASKKKETNGSTSDNTIKKYMYVANVKNSIYLRSEPKEEQSNILFTIPLGEQVGYIETANGAFSKISYNGTIGYAKTCYLSDSAPYSAQTYGSSYMTVCNVKYAIYLRSQPYENSDNIICEIPVGSTVEFLENANGTFYKISWNGNVGYAKSIYLR